MRRNFLSRLQKLVALAELLCEITALAVALFSFPYDPNVRTICLLIGILHSLLNLPT